MDRILYIDEVLEQLHIKISYLYKLINTGELPSFKMGRRRAFMQSDIDAFIVKKTGKTNDKVIDINQLTPEGTMAKGLNSIQWNKYNFDQLCKVLVINRRFRSERIENGRGGL